ncbi:MAG: DUF4912 domain-containing protein [Candidatus Omnitrophota bacterium]
MTKKISFKKQAKAKNTVAKKIKTVEKKALKIKVVKTAKPARKKLGKGLEDISTLFLSDIKKDAVIAKKKTIKSAAKKSVMPKVKKVKSASVKTLGIAIKKSPKKIIAKVAKKPAAAKEIVAKTIAKVETKPAVLKEIVAHKTIAKVETKPVAAKEIVAHKTIAKVETKPAVLKEIVANKTIAKVEKKATAVNDNVPKKTVAKLAKKIAVVKESIPEKVIARVDAKLDAAKDKNPEKTMALTDKKTVKETTGKTLEKIAVKQEEAKQATSKPIMKITEVVGMGTLKKSSKAVKKPKQDKPAEKKSTKTKENKKTQTLGPISDLKTLFKKRKTAGLTVEPQNIQTEQVIEDSKFFVSKETVSRIAEDEFCDLPEGYGDNRIVIQVRDPYWLFAYWEVSQRKLSSVVEKYGSAIHNAKRVLRVHDITSVAFNGKNSNSFFDIAINDVAKNWYVNVGNPGRSYCIDLGLVLADGRFVVFARSNFVTTPIDGPSLITDEEWMIVEDDFNKLYGLSAGLGIGLSSGELRRQIKTKMKNLSSGILSSPGVTTVSPRRNFWMVVNTELIVYGATQPGSELTVQGKPIKLNEDGTFSLRFALPDGEQVIPVRAVSPDKVEERVITPVVKKNTV